MARGVSAEEFDRLVGQSQGTPQGQSKARGVSAIEFDRLVNAPGAVVVTEPPPPVAAPVEPSPEGGYTRTGEALKGIARGVRDMSQAVSGTLPEIAGQMAAGTINAIRAPQYFPGMTAEQAQEITAARQAQPRVQNPLAGWSEAVRPLLETDQASMARFQPAPETTPENAPYYEWGGTGGKIPIPQFGRAQQARLAGEIGQTAPQMAPAVAATAASGGFGAVPAAVGLITGGGLEGLSEYDKAIAEGDSPNVALRRAQTMFAGAGILNALPYTGSAMKYLPKRLRNRVVQGIVTGGLEGVTEMAEGGVSALGKIPQAPQSWEEWRQAFTDIAQGIKNERSVFLAAALMGGAVGVASPVIQPEARAAAQEALSEFEDLGDARPIPPRGSSSASPASQATPGTPPLLTEGGDVRFEPGPARLPAPGNGQIGFEPLARTYDQPITTPTPPQAPPTGPRPYAPLNAGPPPRPTVGRQLEPMDPQFAPPLPQPPANPLPSDVQEVLDSIAKKPAPTPEELRLQEMILNADLVDSREARKSQQDLAMQERQASVVPEIPLVRPVEEETAAPAPAGPATAQNAEFHGWQERPRGQDPIALYNIPEGSGKSTVTAETARQRGFNVPDPTTPPPAPAPTPTSKAKQVADQRRGKGAPTPEAPQAPPAPAPRGQYSPETQAIVDAYGSPAKALAILRKQKAEAIKRQEPLPPETTKAIEEISVGGKRQRENAKAGQTDLFGETPAATPPENRSQVAPGMQTELIAEEIGNETVDVTNDSLAEWRRRVRKQGVKTPRGLTWEDLGFHETRPPARKEATRGWDQWLEEAYDLGLISDAERTEPSTLARLLKGKNVGGIPTAPEGVYVPGAKNLDPDPWDAKPTGTTESLLDIMNRVGLTETKPAPPPAPTPPPSKAKAVADQRREKKGKKAIQETLPASVDMDRVKALVRQANGVGNLFGPRMQDVRQKIMSILEGKSVPKSKAGFNAVRDKLHQISGGTEGTLSSKEKGIDTWAGIEREPRGVPSVPAPDRPALRADFPFEAPEKTTDPLQIEANALAGTELYRNGDRARYTGRVVSDMLEIEMLEGTKQGQMLVALSPAQKDASVAKNQEQYKSQQEQFSRLHKPKTADPAAVRDSIRQAALDVAGGETETRVRLADLREKLPDVPREQQDAALKQMQTDGELVLYRNDDPQDLTPRDEAAKLMLGSDRRDMVYLKPEKVAKAKEPWEMTREEYEKSNPHELRRGSSPSERAKDFNALPDDAEVWVYTATDNDTAEAFLKDGISESQKPTTLARERYEAGEGATFSPGSGLGSGLYVGSSPASVNGYGRRILAVKVAKKAILVPPEGEMLGKTTGMAIADSDAMVSGNIPKGNIIDLGSDPAVANAVGHEAVVRAALAAGKPVPPEVLADYPNLKPEKATTLSQETTSAPEAPAPTGSLEDRFADLVRRQRAGELTPAQFTKERAKLMEEKLKPGKGKGKKPRKRGADPTNPEAGVFNVGIILDLLDAKPFIRFLHGMREEIRDMDIRRKGHTNMLLRQAEAAANDLRYAYQKARGGITAPFRNTPEDLRYRASDYMREPDWGKKQAILATFPVEMQEPLRQLRTIQDQLSQRMIDEDVVSQQRAKTLRANKGSYLVRQYKMFNDPNYQYIIDNAVKDRMRTLLWQQYPEFKNDPNGDVAIEQLLNEWINVGEDDAGNLFWRGSTLGARNFDNLKQRNAFPKEVRDLWGEENDVVKNFTAGVAKQATQLANTRFLFDLVKAGRAGNYIFTQADVRDIIAGKAPQAKVDAYRKLVAENNLVNIADAAELHEQLKGKPAPGKFSSLGPLAETYMSRDVRDSLQEIMKVREVSPVVGTLIQVNGIAKMMKTVGSASTQMLNFGSNIGFALNNGWFFYDVKGLPNRIQTALAITGTELSDRLAKDYREQAGRAIELGVLLDADVSGEIQRMVKEGRSSLLGKPAVMLAQAGERYMANQTSRRKQLTGKAAQLPLAVQYAAGKARDVLVNIYQAGDDFWKALGWLTETAHLQDAYGLPLEQAQDMAAKRMRLFGLPYYSETANIVQLQRYNPISSPFLTFVAEAPRILWNSEVQTKAELTQTGNVKARRMGYRRLMGQMIAYGTPIAAAYMASLYFGIDDKDDETIDKIGPVWNRDATKLVYSSDREKGIVTYLNLSRSSVQAQITDPINAFVNGEDLSDGALRALLTVVDPVLQEQIGWQALRQAVENRDEFDRPVWNKSDSWPEFAYKMTKHFGKALEPGTMDSLWRILHDDAPLEKGIAESLGLRTTTISMPKELQWRAARFQRSGEDTGADVRRALKAEDPIALAEQVQQKEEWHRKEWDLLHEAVSGVLAFGVLPQTVKKSLMNGGMSAVAASRVMNGVYKPQERSKEVKRGLVSTAPETAPVASTGTYAGALY